MNLLSNLFLLLIYFNLNIAFDDEYVINSNENIYNITILERGFTIIVDPSITNLTKPSTTDHAAIQIIIFAACIILLMLIGLLLCSICCKHYRRHHSLITRSSSINSIQELIRERLLDRPPSYHESQCNLNTYQNEDPPTYDEILPNTRAPEHVTNSPVRISTSPPVYTISSKMSTNYANNDLDLPYTECESDTDSPPSYHISEGVVNPVLLQITNISPTENNVQSYSQRESQNVSIHSEFYI